MIKAALRRSLAVAISFSLICPQGLALRAWAAENVVTMDGLAVGSDMVTIKLSAAAQYNGFLTANPPRLVVELFDTENQVGAKEVAGKGRYLKRVRAAQFQRSPQMISRIVMDLNEVTGYRLGLSGRSLVVQLVGDGDAAAAAPPPAPNIKTAAVKTAAAAPPKPRAVPAMESAPIAESGPIVESGETVAAPAVAPEPAPVAVAAAAPAVAAPPAKLKITPKAEAGDVAAKAPPELDAMARSKQVEGAALAAEPSADEDAAARKPSSASRRGSIRGDIMSRLSRDLVTLDFDNTDVRDVLKLLAAKAKVNVIHGADIASVPPLTLHLSDVPFNEAVQTILSMTGLVTTQVGDNILRVLTPAQLAKERTTATTITKVIPLNYTKANDILTAVNNVRAAEGRAGTASANDKTNSLIITESMDGMAATERLISQLDMRPKQVLIEAKLVEVSLGNSLHYGIQWDYFSTESGKLFGKEGQNYNGTTISPTPAPGASLIDGSDYNKNNTHLVNIPAVGASARGTGVQLPATSVFGALTLGRITNNYFLNMTLTAAASQGKVKVLSDPKIATLNNQAANINVTTQYPYVTSNVASTGVTSQSVSYVNVGIKLSVTPTINADGRITLDINPDVSQPSATAAASVTGAPAVDARTAKTTVLVKDGETIVIGGLISDSVSNQIAKIPLLGDIPILGWLFKKKSVVRTRSELLIFVTPKIMPD